MHILSSPLGVRLTLNVVEVVRFLTNKSEELFVSSEIKLLASETNATYLLSSEIIALYDGLRRFDQGFDCRKQRRRLERFLDQTVAGHLARAVLVKGFQQSGGQQDAHMAVPRLAFDELANLVAGLAGKMGIGDHEVRIDIGQTDRAVSPSVTVTTSKPSSRRILSPIRWACGLSSAKRFRLIPTFSFSPASPSRLVRRASTAVEWSPRSARPPIWRASGWVSSAEDPVPWRGHIGAGGSGGGRGLSAGTRTGIVGLRLVMGGRPDLAAAAASGLLLKMPHTWLIMPGLAILDLVLHAREATGSASGTACSRRSEFGLA